MAGVKTPTSFKAGRKVSFEGITYQPGDTVPNAVVAGIRRLTALIGRGFLVPNIERRGIGRQGRVARPTTSLAPSERRTLGA